MPYAAPASASSPPQSFIVNGGMQVAQTRIPSSSGSPPGSTLNGVNQIFYGAAPDNWALRYTSGTPQGVAALVVADNPINGRGGNCYYLRYDNSGFGANDYVVARTAIEGQFIRPLFGQSCYLNFSLVSPVVGVFTAILFDPNSGRYFPFSYRVTEINAWKRYSVPISFPSTLSFLNPFTTAAQLLIYWPLFVGSNLRFSASNLGQWNPVFTGAYAAVGANNLWPNNLTSQIVKLANVSISLGLESVFSFNNFADDLALCQRYYWQTFEYGVAPIQAYGSTLGALNYRPGVAGVSPSGFYLPYPVPMRTTPVVTFYNPIANNALWRNQTAGADSGAASVEAVTSYPNARAAYIRNAQAAGDAVGNDLYIHASFDARM